MKKKLFTLIAGSAVAFSALTGCSNIKLPGNNQNSNQDPSNPNQEVTSQPVTENSEVTGVDRVNQIIGNSLNLLERKLNEPMLYAKTDINYSALTSGTTQRVVTNYDSNTGALINRIEDGKQPVSSKVDGKFNAVANIDNLYYLAKLNNHADNLRNKTLLSYANKVSTYENNNLYGTNYNASYIGSGNIYYTNMENAPYDRVTENDIDYIDRQIGESLDIVHTVASLDFDLTVETFTHLIKLVSLAGGFGPQRAYGYIADFVENTLDFVNSDMSSEDYLNYVCTRYLAIDTTLFSTQDRTAIIAILSSLQTVNTDSFFTVEEELSKITVSLNYQNVLDTINLGVTALSALEAYLETTLNNYTIDGLSDEVSQIVTKLPKNIELVRTFNTKRDCITKYDLTLNITDGELGGSVSSTGDYGQEGIQTVEEISTKITDLASNLSIDFEFLDSAIAVNKPNVR